MPSAAAAVAVTATRSAWLDFLTAASRIAAKGKPIPIYGCALLDCQRDRIQWWVTDGTLWRSGRLDGSVDTAIRLIVPQAEFAAIVKATPDSDISLAMDSGSRLAVSAGRFVAHLPTFPDEEFPATPIVPTAWHEMPASICVRLSREIIPAIWQDHTLTACRGSLLCFDQDKVTFTATDGHRLAIASTPLAGAKSVQTVLSQPLLVELADIASEGDVMRYAVTESAHQFAVGTSVVCGRPIDGWFPRVVHLIDSVESRTRLVADRKALIAAVKRMALVTDKGSFRMKCSAAEGALTLTAESSQKGSARDVFGVEHDGADAVFHINPRYLTEALDATDSERVALVHDNPSKPLLVLPVGSADYRHGISQMRA